MEEDLSWNGELPVLKGPIFFLHGTSTIYLPLIETQGLKDPYLTDQEKMAAYFADTATIIDPPTRDLIKSLGLSTKNNRPIVLQVAVYDPKKLRVDREMWAEPLDFVKREHDIERDQEWYEAMKEGYIETPENDFDWRTSLKIVHAVKYEGTILPKHLGVARRPRA